MKKNPKFSLITPCYNAVEFIEETILSIINQDYENIEYIIIDGGSNDGTVEIIKKYEDKLAFWVSEDDKGQSDAINKGIQKATGDIFNWVNADDYLEEGIIKKVAKLFEEKSLNVLCTKTILFNEYGDIRTNSVTPINKGLFGLLNSKGLNQMGMFWRLDKIKALKGVNTDFNYSMDLDLWKRYLLTFGLDKVEEADLNCGYFRMSSDSKTGADFETNFHLFDEENNAALLQYATEVGSKYQDTIKFLYPGFKELLAIKKVHSDINVTRTKEWLLFLFYEKAKRFFYANDFKQAYRLIKRMPIEDYQGEELRNLKSFKRWSSIKQYTNG